MKSKSLQELAELYCKHPAAGLRSAIIRKSIPLIRSIIGKINKPDQLLAQNEDLESAGISGLIQAMDSYDCRRNIQFNTYVYYRIRGNIIDYLRKIDQLPRNQRKLYGQVKQATEHLYQKLWREPTDEEVANELNMDINDYRQLLSNVQKRNALSLDHPFDDDSKTFYDFHSNPDVASPDQNLEKKELKEALQKKISQLGERDRLILTLYYYEDMTMNEIAVLLELSEARISQIVGKLLLQLKQELERDRFVQTGI